MRNVPDLNHTIGRALMQRLSLDPRLVATFLAAVVCVLASKHVALSEWLSWVTWDIKAASRVRHFARWLGNPSILPHVWYAVIWGYAMRSWTQMPIFLTLDTTMLFGRFCCVRISMIYLNRAIPVAWCVLEHKSSTVKYEKYAHLLKRVSDMLPRDVEVFSLADRGFVSKKLMRHFQELHWHWRIRVKGNQQLSSKGRIIVPKTLPLCPGKALLFSESINFGKGLDRLSLSAGWARGSREPWYVLSADKACLEVFMDYARRFGIEEGFRDEKSGGFNLEESRIRDAQKLERLILVVAVASIVAVSEGVSGVLEGRREEVDPHWKQGLSYFKIGLRGILSAIVHKLEDFFGYFLLRPINNPLPIAPTEKESRRRRKMKDPKYLFWDVQYC